MTGWRKTSILIAVLVAASVSGAVLAVRIAAARSVTFRGAVIRRYSDPNRQSPIAGAEIIATDGNVTAKTASDAEGAFRVTLHFALPTYKQSVTLHITHENYEPLEL